MRLRQTRISVTDHALERHWERVGAPNRVLGVGGGGRVRVVYVSRDKSHPLRGRQGVVLIRARGPGPRNELVRLDDGRLVCAPWGNWRKVPQTGGEGNLGRASKY